MSALLAGLAKELLAGLVSGIKKHVGIQIVSQIFGERVPSFYTESCKLIERIVPQQMTASKIEQLDGEINGLIKYMAYEYNARKDSGASKQDLFESLRHNIHDVSIHIIAVLQQPQFAAISLPVFVIGASLHLLMLQEACLVDPHVSNPLQSSYMLTLKLYAEDYASYAEQHYSHLLAERKSMISSVVVFTRLVPEIPVCGPAKANTVYIAKYKDFLTGFKAVDQTSLINGLLTNGTPQELQEKLEKSRSEYIAVVEEQFPMTLNDPLFAATSWKKLVHHPLPTPEEYMY